MTSDRCAEVAPLHSAWLDDELSPAERARVTAHVAGCATCAEEVERLRVTRAQLRSLPVRGVPSGLLDGTRERAGAPGADAVPPVTAARLGAVAAVLAGLLGGAAFSLGAEPLPAPRRVAVPVEVFVADHLVHTVGGPVATPPLTEASR